MKNHHNLFKKVKHFFDPKRVYKTLRKLYFAIIPKGSKSYQNTYGFFRILIRKMFPLNILYQKWIKLFDTYSTEDLENDSNLIPPSGTLPQFSIIMPVYHPKREYLDQAIQSVLQQVYPHWELCIADDGSPNPEIQYLIQDYAQKDSRIRVVFRKERGHISAASNSALGLASNEYITFQDHDDKLHPLALYHVAKKIIDFPKSDMIYSDEDKMSPKGHRLDPYFKPDYDYELFLNHNYLIHLVVSKLSLVRRVGGFRLGFEGSQDYDLILRLLDQIKPEHIHHIPRVLYHWRMSNKSAAQNIDVKPYAVTAAMHALDEHFERNSIAGSVEFIPELAVYRPHYQIHEPEPSVEIINISPRLSNQTFQMIKSLSSNSHYRNFHLSVYSEEGSEAIKPQDPQNLKDHPQISMESYEATKSQTQIINDHIAKTQADLFCILKPCCLNFSSGWLRKLVEQANQEGIGIVGPKLVDRQGKIYSNGMILGVGRLATHLFNGQPADDPGYLFWAMLQRGYSVLSSECWLFSKPTFNQIHGLDPKFTSAKYRDIDFCLKLRSENLRNIIMPSVVLTVDVNQTEYHASQEHSSEVRDQERKSLFEHWQAWIENDPAFNPNLTLKNGAITLNLSPRNRPDKS